MILAAIRLLLPLQGNVPASQPKHHNGSVLKCTMKINIPSVTAPLSNHSSSPGDCQTFCQVLSEIRHKDEDIMLIPCRCIIN